jgi:Zn-dependent protease
MDVNLIFSIVILIFSVILHEVSHGYAAEMQGDPTARMAGRLTLNPISHLDLYGSIIVPVICYFIGGFIVGWAKPVPFNPYNLRNQRWGEAVVAGAGPAMNIFIAVIFGLFLRFYPLESIPGEIIGLISTIIIINLVLAVFNLMPIPPLDGSKILFSLFPNNMAPFRDFMERYSLAFILVFIFFIWKLIVPAVFFLFQLITGLS